VYTSDTQRSINYTTGNWDSQLYIKDLRNAFKTGADCQAFVMDGKETDSVDKFISSCKYSVGEMLRRCEQAMTTLVEGRYSVTIETEEYTVTIRINDSKGVRTFSPLPEALKVLKPLNEIPKKWTLRHVMRLLANGQHVDLRTRARYTDDYAMDAAYDYYKGAICGINFLKDLTNSPSGWWISGTEKDGTKLGINCHHFDYKECTLDISGKLREEARANAAAEAKVKAKAQEEAEQTPPPAMSGVLMSAPLAPQTNSIH
jgi:hypothetical protein